MEKRIEKSDADQVIDAARHDALASLRDQAQKLTTEIEAIENSARERLLPLRADLSKLETWIARLEGANSTSATTAARAPRGHNRASILDLLASRPNLSAADVAEATGMSKNTANVTLHRLTQAKKTQRFEVDGRVVYRLR